MYGILNYKFFTEHNPLNTYILGDQKCYYEYLTSQSNNVLMKEVSEQWVHHHLSCQRRSRWDNRVGRGANTSWTSSAHLLLSLNPSPCERSRPSSAFSTCVCLQVGWGWHKCCQKLRQTKDAFTLWANNRPVTEPACS